MFTLVPGTPLPSWPSWGGAGGPGFSQSPADKGVGTPRAWALALPRVTDAAGLFLTPSVLVFRWVAQGWPCGCLAAPLTEP